MKTRSTAPHWLFGGPLYELDPLYLPSELDICQYFFYIRSFLLNIKNRRQLNDDEKNDIVNTILGEIMDIWKSSSIPFKKELAIKDKLKRLIHKADSLARSNVSYRWHKQHNTE